MLNSLVSKVVSNGSYCALERENVNKILGKEGQLFLQESKDVLTLDVFPGHLKSDLIQQAQPPSCIKQRGSKREVVATGFFKMAIQKKKTPLFFIHLIIFFSSDKCSIGIWAQCMNLAVGGWQSVGDISVRELKSPEDSPWIVMMVSHPILVNHASRDSSSSVD